MAAAPANVLPWRTRSLRPLALRAKERTGADGIAVALKIDGDILCEASVGAAPAVGSKVDANSRWSTRCLTEAKPVCISHTGINPQASYSAILAPILHAGTAIGFCAAFASRAEAFTPAHVRILQEMARSAVRSVNGCPQAQPDLVSMQAVLPPRQLSPELLKQVDEEIGAFSVEEKQRGRRQLISRCALASVLALATCASFFPDQIQQWAQPILYRINHSLPSAPPPHTRPVVTPPPAPAAEYTAKR